MSATSGDGDQSPENHIPELLRSNTPALAPTVDPTWVDFNLVGCPGNDPGQPKLQFYRLRRVLSGIPPLLFSTAGRQKKEPGLLSRIRAPFAGTVIYSITQDDYMVIPPDC
jgi:hypothetical protein